MYYQLQQTKEDISYVNGSMLHDIRTRKTFMRLIRCVNVSTLNAREETNCNISERREKIVVLYNKLKN